MPASSSPPPARPGSWVDDERAHAPGDEPELELVLEEGTLLASKYRLLRPAGFGGMAQLWVARNESTAAEVCVKVLVPERSDDESVQRFRREAHAAARLSHRAIVRVFDFVELGADGGVAAGRPPKAFAIVMELLTGETLGDVLMKRGRLPLEEALDIAVPVLSALAHAHRAGIVHRDVKPDNIFLAVDPDGHVTPKVLDFGVSKLQTNTQTLTSDGVMLGTPSFMSPEQARGARDIDARSDVFSAAILVYLMLSGKNPFESETFHSVLSAILEREPARLADVPDQLWAVLEKAFAKDPAARYADATELGIALRRAAGRAVVTESGTHPVSRAPLDSVVSVPPVGSDSGVLSRPGEEEPAPESVLPPPFPRGRYLALAGAVVGIAAVIGLAALLRGSPAPGPSAPVSTATSAPPQAPPVTASAAPEPAPSSAPSAPAMVDTAPTAAPDAAARSPAVTVAPPRSPPPRPPRKDPPPPPSATGPREIARDPGF